MKSVIRVTAICLLVSSPMLSLPVSAASDPFNETITFDELEVGSIDGDFKLVWITGSWYPFSDEFDCGDGGSPNEGGRCLIIDYPGEPLCYTNRGVAIADTDTQSLNGILNLNFKPGYCPDTVSFDLRQYAATGPIHIFVYDLTGALVDSLSDDTSHWVVGLSQPAGISRVEIQCTFPATLDTVSFSGTISDPAYDVTLDFESLDPEPISGAFDLVNFIADPHEEPLEDLMDAVAMGNGTRCLVLDGGNPRNNDPAERWGVAISVVDDPDEEAPYTCSYNGILTAVFNPAAPPLFVEFDLFQYSITGPVTVRAYNALGFLLCEQMYEANDCHVALTSPQGVGFITIDGEHPFSVDDFRMVRTTPVCAADTNGDGIVDVVDLLFLLGNWGACP